MMLPLFFAYQIDAMRRVARKISRDEGIPLCQAQHRIAMDNGYRNWSLLMKNGQQDPSVRPYFFFRRTDEEVAASMRFVPDPGRYGQSREEMARTRAVDLCQSFADTRNAIDFAIDYLEAILRQPRFRVFAEAPVYWEMRYWLPYVVHPIDEQPNQCILLNRNYKPVGTTSREYVQYERFPHLHMTLDGDSWRKFAHPRATEAYLFDDGSRPWLSRQTATAYLDRLRRIEV